MGTILASAIMATASGFLHDEGYDRWTEEWLFSGVNHGQREICALKPDANLVSGAVQLAAGTYQSLPAGGLVLLRISHNMGAVRLRRQDPQAVRGHPPSTVKRARLCLHDVWRAASRFSQSRQLRCGNRNWRRARQCADRVLLLLVLRKGRRFF